MRGREEGESERTGRRATSRATSRVIGNGSSRWRRGAGGRSFSAFLSPSPECFHGGSNCILVAIGV